MPTIIGHAAAGMAVSRGFFLKRWDLLAAVTAILCALLPDIDSLGFVMGVPYGSKYGHRGISHSFAFSAAVALFFSLTVYMAIPRQANRLKLFVCFFIAGISHGLLDAMTDGGLGVAFFAPFSNVRYFLPWRPIPVSAIGIAASLRGRGPGVFFFEFLHLALPSAGFIAVVALIKKVRGRRNLDNRGT